MMCKKIKAVGAVALLLLLISIVFTACTGETKPPKPTEPSEYSTAVTESESTSATSATVGADGIISTCFLIGNTRNVQSPNQSLISEQLWALSENKEAFSVVVLDGKPDASSYSADVKLPFRFFGKSANDQAVIAKLTKNILNVMPKEDEIDILKGLASGAKAFSKSAEEKELIVFSSGISTEGVLNFAEHPDWIEKKPSEIVDMLDQTKSLPDLSDVHITWYGFGDVEGAQKELSDFNYYRLKNIWKAILEASGVRDAASVFDDMLAIEDESAEAPKEYPPVTPVDFPEMIVIDEKDIGFVRDSANFSDEQKAIDALEYYAQCINDIGHTFYIVGTTATADTIENCFLCSQERADAVKKILCESYNVPEALLQTYALGQINLGGEYAWRYADLDGNNKLIPDIAQKNRRVMLIDATSETGQKFLQDWTSGDIAKS